MRKWLRSWSCWENVSVSLNLKRLSKNRKLSLWKYIWQSSKPYWKYSWQRSKPLWNDSWQNVSLSLNLKRVSKQRKLSFWNYSWQSSCNCRRKNISKRSRVRRKGLLSTRLRMRLSRCALKRMRLRRRWGMTSCSIFSWADRTRMNLVRGLRLVTTKLSMNSSKKGR